jgi:methionine synthase / methylenetetrahydrofolate reductase (NADH)
MKLSDAIRERVLVAEGAMGTRLFAKGVAPDACLELLNLTNPSLVREIHHEYRDAGAEVFKTNTFGATTIRLSRHSTEAKCHAINIAGVEIARSVAGVKGFVLGAVGPAADVQSTAVRDAYAAQIDALVQAGVDGILFETFRDLDHLTMAIAVAKRACDLPVIAQVSPDQHGNLAGGIGPERYGPALAACGIAALGVNCGESLASMLQTFGRLAAAISLPLTAQPSAGRPVLREGRAIYPVSPEEFSAAATQFVQMGARLVGGCCGTEPAHIAAVRAAVDRAPARRATPATGEAP